MFLESKYIGDLKSGDTFILNDRVWLILIQGENFEVSDVWPIAAVDLTTGRLNRFKEDIEVVPVNLKAEFKCQLK